MTEQPNDKPKKNPLLDRLRELMHAVEVPTEHLGVLRATELRAGQVVALDAQMGALDTTNDRAVAHAFMCLTLGYPDPNDDKDILPLSEAVLAELTDRDLYEFSDRYLKGVLGHTTKDDPVAGIAGHVRTTSAESQASHKAMLESLKSSVMLDAGLMSMWPDLKAQLGATDHLHSALEDLRRSLDPMLGTMNDVQNFFKDNSSTAIGDILKGIHGEQGSIGDLLKGINRERDLIGGAYEGIVSGTPPFETPPGSFIPRIPPLDPDILRSPLPDIETHSAKTAEAVGRLVGLAEGVSQHVDHMVAHVGRMSAALIQMSQQAAQDALESQERHQLAMRTQAEQSALAQHAMAIQAADAAAAAARTDRHANRALVASFFAIVLAALVPVAISWFESRAGSQQSEREIAMLAELTRQNETLAALAAQESAEAAERENSRVVQEASAAALQALVKLQEEEAAARAAALTPQPQERMR